MRGKPPIAGHRIKVQDIVVWYEFRGMSPDEIVYHYPNISLSDVYAALAYYYDHLEEIRQDMEESEHFINSLANQTPSLLESKMKMLLMQ